MSKLNFKKEQRVEFGYVYEDKTVTAYLMYISYIINDEKYFYTKIKYVKKEDNIVVHDEMFLVGQFIKTFIDFAFIFKHYTVENFIQLDINQAIEFCTNVLMHSFSLQDYISFNDFKVYVSDVFQRIKLEDEVNPVTYMQIVDIANEYQMNSVELNNNETKMAFTWFIGLSVFLLDSSNLKDWAVSGALNPINFLDFPFLVSNDQNLSNEINVKNNYVFKNYSSEALIRVDFLPSSFLNVKVKYRLINSNLYYLKDISMLFSILKLSDYEIEYHANWSDYEKAGTLLLKETVKKFFSGMKIPNATQQLKII